MKHRQQRRRLLQWAAAVPFLPGGAAAALAGAPTGTPAIARCRPGDAGWPGESQWQALRQRVGGRLITPHSPLQTCLRSPGEPACEAVLEALKNPYFIGDEVALTQTLGWVDAWTSRPSAYAVAARDTGDVVAAVDFARTHNLRLVVKGGGHSYQGTSSAADSLLVWTRRMNDITLHDSFVASGCTAPPTRAVTVGAGAIWAQVYDAVTTRGGGYVQGGGCTTVGVAGLIQSGGFGSFSKAFGLASASLLQAEVVTADGVVRIANACTHPDLFWALKGGGGGSLGIVTRLTLRVHAAARNLRRGEPQHPGGLGECLSQADRHGARVLRHQPDEPALGRTDPPAPRQRAEHRDGLPGTQPKPGAAGLATVPGCRGGRAR